MYNTSDHQESTSALDDHHFAMRLGDLRQDLHEYSLHRWRGLLFRELQRDLKRPHLKNGDQLEMLQARLSAMCCTVRLSDGRTPVERFAEEHAYLFPEERATLRRWAEIEPGPFDIVAVEPPLLHLVPLRPGGPAAPPDGPRWRLRACVDPRLFDLIQPGGIVMGDLVPVRDFHITLGVIQLTPAEVRAEVIQMFIEAGYPGRREGRS